MRRALYHGVGEFRSKEERPDDDYRYEAGPYSTRKRERLEDFHGLEVRPLFGGYLPRAWQSAGNRTLQG